MPMQPCIQIKSTKQVQEWLKGEQMQYSVQYNDYAIAE